MGNSKVPKPPGQLEKLKECLQAMARGADMWDLFLVLQGKFILHVLKSDYAFYDEFDPHSRQEILHDIYLRTAKNAYKMVEFENELAIQGYLRRIIASANGNQHRIVQRFRRDLILESEHKFPPPKADVKFNPLAWLETNWWLRNKLPLINQAIQKVTANTRNPGRNQEILAFRMVRGKPYSEIAEKTGASEANCRRVVSDFKPRILKAINESVGFSWVPEQDK